MNNLRQYSLEKIQTFWNAGQVSIIEVISYLLTYFIAQQHRLDELEAQLMTLNHVQQATNLTLYRLKNEVDSQAVRNEK